MNTLSLLRRGATLTLLAAGSLLSGCGTLPDRISDKLTIEPWVKPYERERLADPVMKLARESLPDRHRQHVRDVREGARGATGVQGGGCGCN
jgi:hypothetical protein